MNCKVNIEASLEADSRLLFHNIAYTHNNFYLNNAWYVISINNIYSPDKPIIYFPEIDYTQILEYGVKCNYKVNDYNSEELKKIEFIKKVLQPVYKTQLKITKNKLDRYTSEVRPLIFDTVKKLRKIFPILEKKEFVVNCYITKIGTHGSFDYIDFNKDTITFNIWLRIDQPALRIVELLVSSVTRSLEDVSNKISWRETEAVSDFIVKHMLGHKAFSGTLESVSVFSPELLNESLVFMREHGLPFSRVLTYDQENNRIYLLGKDISDTLGSYEFRMLRALILNANKTVSYQVLSYEMYKEKAPDKFSLWGLSKTVQRVRDHLNQYGIPREYIKTVRGEGVKLMV